MQWFSTVRVEMKPGLKMNSVTGDKNYFLAGHRYQSLLLQFLNPTIRADLCAGKIDRVPSLDLRLQMYDYNFILKLLDLLAPSYSASFLSLEICDEDYGGRNNCLFK